MYLEEGTGGPVAAAAAELIFECRAGIPNIDALVGMTCTTAAWEAAPGASIKPTALPNPGPGVPGACNPQGNAWPTVVLEVSFFRTIYLFLSLFPSKS